MPDQHGNADTPTEQAMWTAGVRAALESAALTCLERRDCEHSPPSDWEQETLTHLSAAILRRQIGFSPNGMSQVLGDIAQERQRQQQAEGWTVEHDDGHSRGEMALAAAAYAYNAGQADVGRAWPVAERQSGPVAERPSRANRQADFAGNVGRHPVVWPWSAEWWKPKDRRRDLVRAAALIVAEIERLDRNAAQASITPVLKAG